MVEARKDILGLGSIARKKSYFGSSSSEVTPSIKGVL
jgi:hypothetical protein